MLDSTFWLKETRCSYRNTGNGDFEVIIKVVEETLSACCSVVVRRPEGGPEKQGRKRGWLAALVGTIHTVLTQA